jgi:hypothetical protein
MASGAAVGGHQPDLLPLYGEEDTVQGVAALVMRHREAGLREHDAIRLRAFEKRLLDEEAHYLYTLQWHRIVPLNAKVRGWTITPSHFLNQQLDGVGLAE